jgi:glycosyltransferase involved in cell wall biosynthesis
MESEAGELNNNLIEISVVMPSFQSALFIHNTLQSIVEQTILPSQVLIVDDGSTDSTCLIIEEFSKTYPELNIELIRSSHKGPGAARNIGVQRATSQWISFLDSDDLWFPNKLETCLKAIRENHQSNFFCHNETMIAEDCSTTLLDYSKLYSPDKPITEQLFKINLFSTSAVVCKRADILNVGGFDETLSSAQDYELWLRMSPKLSPYFIKKVLGTYTIRQGNISTTRHFKRLKNIWRVLSRHRKKAQNLSTFLFIFCRVSLSHIAGFFRSTFK